MSSFVSLAFHLEIVLSPLFLQVVFFASEAIITRFFKHRRATFSYQRQKNTWISGVGNTPPSWAAAGRCVDERVTWKWAGSQRYFKHSCFFNYFPRHNGSWRFGSWFYGWNDQKKTLQIQFHVSFDNHCLSIDFHYFEQSLIYGMAKKRILWWETGFWLLQVSLLMMTFLQGSWWWRWEIVMKMINSKMLGGEISWWRWSSISSRDEIRYPIAHDIELKVSALLTSWLFPLFRHREIFPDGLRSRLRTR